MNNSEIGKGFNQQAQSAQNPNEQIEQNKQYMRIDGNPPLENKASFEHETYIPTLDMKGSEAQKVRQGVFEEKQAKLWMDNYQKAPQEQAKNPLDQEFKQSAAKPLTASFFDSLSDENKAKIEAYKQAKPEQKQEQLSQKKGYGSSDL